MSRPELVQIAKELKIEWKGLSIHELTVALRKESDRRFKKKYKVGSSWMSNTLKKFLVEEYDYVLKDRKGNKTKKIEEIKK